MSRLQSSKDLPEDIWLEGNTDKRLEKLLYVNRLCAGISQGNYTRS